MANSKFINLKWPLRKYRRGFFEGNNTTINAVTEDIKILLLTRRGERLIHTDMGSNISVFDSILFEQTNKAEFKATIEGEIITLLEKWMPHVKLTKLEILDRDDSPGLTVNQILIKMNYVLTNAEQLGDSIEIKVG